MARAHDPHIGELRGRRRLGDPALMVPPTGSYVCRGRMTRTSLVPPTSPRVSVPALASKRRRRRTSEGALSASRALLRRGGALTRLVEFRAWRYATLRGWKSGMVEWWKSGRRTRG